MVPLGSGTYGTVFKANLDNMPIVVKAGNEVPKAQKYLRRGNEPTVTNATNRNSTQGNNQILFFDCYDQRVVIRVYYTYATL